MKKRTVTVIQRVVVIVCAMAVILCVIMLGQQSYTLRPETYIAHAVNYIQDGKWLESTSPSALKSALEGALDKNDYCISKLERIGDTNDYWVNIEYRSIDLAGICLDPNLVNYYIDTLVKLEKNPTYPWNRKLIALDSYSSRVLTAVESAQTTKEGSIKVKVYQKFLTYHISQDDTNLIAENLLGLDTDKFNKAMDQAYQIALERIVGFKN